MERFRDGIAAEITTHGAVQAAYFPPLRLDLSPDKDFAKMFSIFGLCSQSEI